MRKSRLQAQETKQQLLDAALEVFWQNGVTNTTLQEIAQEAGVTRGALYWHFKNKEDLFSALFERSYEPFMQKFKLDSAQNIQALDHLRDGFEHLFLSLENNIQQRKFCNVMHLKCEYTAKNEIVTRLVQSYHQRSQDQVLQVLQLCCQQKKLPENLDVKKAALYLKSSLVGLIQMWVEYPEQIPLHEMGMLMVDICIDTLQNNSKFCT